MSSNDKYETALMIFAAAMQALAIIAIIAYSTAPVWLPLITKS